MEWESEKLSACLVNVSIASERVSKRWSVRTGGHEYRGFQKRCARENIKKWFRGIRQTVNRKSNTYASTMVYVPRTYTIGIYKHINTYLRIWHTNLRLYKRRYDCTVYETKNNQKASKWVWEAEECKVKKVNHRVM